MSGLKHATPLRLLSSMLDQERQASQKDKREIGESKGEEEGEEKGGVYEEMIGHQLEQSYVHSVRERKQYPSLKNLSNLPGFI